MMMRIALGAVARGVAIGFASAIGMGVITAVGKTVLDWPEPGLGPSVRSRHLAEGISAGMFLALVASFVLVPACSLWLVHRSRASRRA